MKPLTREDMYRTLCEWSFRSWDKDKHYPSHINVFAGDTVYRLDGQGRKAELKELPDTAEDIRWLALERYGIVIEGEITKIEFQCSPNRIQFSFK